MQWGFTIESVNEQKRNLVRHKMEVMMRMHAGTPEGWMDAVFYFKFNVSHVGVICRPSSPQQYVPVPHNWLSSCSNNRDGDESIWGALKMALLNTGN